MKRFNLQRRILLLFVLSWELSAQSESVAAIVRDLARLTLESHQGEETLELTPWYGTPVAELTSRN